MYKNRAKYFWAWIECDLATISHKLHRRRDCLIPNVITANSRTSRSILGIPRIDCEARWKKGDHNGDEFLCHGYSNSESLGFARSFVRSLDQSLCIVIFHLTTYRFPNWTHKCKIKMFKMKEKFEKFYFFSHLKTKIFQRHIKCMSKNKIYYMYFYPK